MTAALFNDGLRLGLSPPDVHSPQQRTEGWAAGLYLAGQSLLGRPDPSRFIQAFASYDCQIVDYLVTEVLDGPPTPVRSFLLRTSVRDRPWSRFVGSDRDQGLGVPDRPRGRAATSLSCRQEWHCGR